jgi:phosphatidate cytidylyltransferase
MRKTIGDNGEGHPPASAPSSRSGWLANLRLRVATAAALIPIVIILAWLGGWVTAAGVLIVLLLAARELHRMLVRKDWQPLTVVSIALSIDFLVAARLPEARLLLAVGISCTVVGVSGWLLIARPVSEQTLVSWALTLAIPFYLGWPLALLVALRGDGIGPDAPGFWWLLVLLLGVWANDSGALFCGHYFGRAGLHLLAPRLSPKKTWEGVAGGAVCAIIAVLVVAGVAGRVPAHPLVALAWYHGLALGVLLAAAATLGDLSKSLFKRVTGVKDSGTLLPGHGGMLDRVDSTLFAVYVVFFYALGLGAL